MCDTANKKISNVYVLLHFTTAVDDETNERGGSAEEPLRICQRANIS
jgi:hypothetical protein